MLGHQNVYFGRGHQIEFACSRKVTRSIHPIFGNLVSLPILLLLHNDSNSGGKYLIESKGQDEKGLGDVAEHGVDYEEANIKDNKEVNTKDKKHDTDGEEYIFGFFPNYGGYGGYGRYGGYRRGAGRGYGRRPNMGRGSCPKF